jgi:hypothetical protein
MSRNIAMFALALQSFDWQSNVGTIYFGRYFRTCAPPMSLLSCRSVSFSA